MCILWSVCGNNGQWAPTYVSPDPISNRKFTCGNSILRDKTLTHYICRTMSTWDQYEKATAAWIHRTRTKTIHAPGHPPLITLHHPPNLEYSTHPTKKSFSSQNFTQLDSLSLELLRNICMWHVGLVHCNKLKPVLVQLTRHHPVLCASTSYKIEYIPFDLFRHNGVIKYVWADRRLGPHKSKPPPVESTKVVL